MMGNSELKFVFLKTPQLRHKFMSHDTLNIFPVIRHEIYYAKLVEEHYEIFGRSYSGAVAIDDFN